jgi:23S rRNA (adenine-N6)-dimethyltransferase
LAAVLLHPWFEAGIVHAFRRTDFLPVPRVEAVMLRLRKRGPPMVTPCHTQVYRDFVVTLFTTPGNSINGSLAQLAGHRRGRLIAQTCGVADAAPAAVPSSKWLELFESTESLLDTALGQRVQLAEHRLRLSQRRLVKLHRTRSRHLRPPPADSSFPRRRSSPQGRTRLPALA